MQVTILVIQNGVTLDDAIETLQNDSAELNKWFKDKQMKVHKDKCHFFQ